MSKFLKIALPIAAMLVAIAASVVLFVTRPKVQHKPAVIKIPLVTVSKAKSKSMHIPVFTRGTVAPGTQIQLLSEVSGQVLEVSPDFANGGFFHKDEVLYKVDPLQYDVNIKRAEAQQAQAYQAYLQAQAEKEARARSHVRNKNQLASFEVQFRQAEAAYLAAKAELEAAKLQKQRTVIRAPFDGRVLMARLNVGQFLSPGLQVGTIYAVDHAEVRLPLSDRQLSLVDVPARLTPAEQKELPKVIFSETFGGKTFTWNGQIVRAEGSVDERNRLLYVVAQVPNPYGVDPNQPGRPDLVAGSFVEAKIAGRKFDRVFPIPRRALRNGNQIWIVGDDGRLDRRDVGILYKSKDTIFVSTGLDDGDEVVLSQMDIAVEGMRVRTRSAENPQDLQESTKAANPFADNQPVDPAISGAIKPTKNGAVLNVSPDQARELAAKAKQFVDNLDDDQKAKLKQNAANIAKQLNQLQKNLNQAAKPAAVVASTPAPTQKPSQQPQPAAGSQQPMSPLASQIEHDMANEQSTESTPQPATTVASAPSPAPAQQAAAAPQQKAQNLVADSASNKSASVNAISTVAAPKPLLEANQ